MVQTKKSIARASPNRVRKIINHSERVKSIAYGIAIRNEARKTQALKGRSHIGFQAFSLTNETVYCRWASPNGN